MTSAPQTPLSKTLPATAPHNLHEDLAHFNSPEGQVIGRDIGKRSLLQYLRDRGQEIVSYGGMAAMSAAIFVGVTVPVLGLGWAIGLSVLAMGLTSAMLYALPKVFDITMVRKPEHKWDNYVKKHADAAQNGQDNDYAHILKHGDLQAITAEYARRAGLNFVPHLLVVDFSALSKEKTKDGKTPAIANAAALSLGETRLVFVTPEIVKALEPNELRAVIAHEVTHIAQKHTLPRLLSMPINAPTAGAVAFLLPLGVLFGAVPVSLAALGTYLGWQTLHGWLGTFHSRRVEWEADKGAVRLTRDPLALASALRKISAINQLAVLDLQKTRKKKLGYVDRLILKIPGAKHLYLTHPPTDWRTQVLEDYAKTRLAPMANSTVAANALPAAEEVGVLYRSFNENRRDISFNTPPGRIEAPNLLQNFAKNGGFGGLFNKGGFGGGANRGGPNRGDLRDFNRRQQKPQRPPQQ